jgi:hypothetical protein
MSWQAILPYPIQASKFSCVEEVEKAGAYKTHSPSCIKRRSDNDNTHPRLFFGMDTLGCIDSVCLDVKTYFWFQDFTGARMMNYYT